MDIKQDIDIIFRNYVIDISKNHTHNLNIFHGSSLNYLGIYDKNSTMSHHIHNNKKIENHTEKNVSKFSFYHTQTQINSNPNSYTRISIDEDVQELFFNELIKIIPPSHLDEFISVSGKLLSLSDRLNIVKNNKELFKKLFTVKKKNFISIPDNRDFSISLNLLKDNINNQSEQISLLEQYCQNHVLLFKRIEIQNLLKDFIYRNYSTLENFNDVTKKLSSFYIDVEGNSQINPFKSCFPVYFYDIDRKKLFTKYYHEQLTDKHYLNLFMSQIDTFFNSKEILKKYNLSQVFFVNCEGSGRTSYNFIFQTNQTEQIYNYEDLLNQLFKMGIPKINSPFNYQEDWNNLFDTILNYFLLDSKLTQNNKEKTKKINKI